MMVLSSDTVVENGEDDGSMAMMTILGTTLVMAITSGPPLALSQAASSLPLQWSLRPEPHILEIVCRL